MICTLHANFVFNTSSDKGICTFSCLWKKIPATLCTVFNTRAENTGKISMTENNRRMTMECLYRHKKVKRVREGREGGTASVSNIKEF